ncbi:glycosyl hydrolase family 65 protein [Alkalibacterium psychrotolerans]
MVKINIEDFCWKLIDNSIRKESIINNETLFSLSNGHVGTRGSLEESHLVSDYGHSEATLVNGYYDSEPIQYGEWAYGYAKNHQTVIPVPHGKHVVIEVNGTPFTLEEGKVLEHSRQLNLKEGLLTRAFKWEAPSGEVIEGRFERLVSYRYPEIVAQSLTIKAVESEVPIKVSFELDELDTLGKQTAEDDNDPRVKAQKERRFTIENRESKDDSTYVQIQTKASDLSLWVGSFVSTYSEQLQRNAENQSVSFEGSIKEGDIVTFEQFTAYSNQFSSGDDAEKVLKHLHNQMQTVRDLGFEKVKAQHLEDMAEFWKQSDIEIDGDDQLQLGLRFNLFHLNQAAARDGKRNMSAKGLTGEGYEGHYFWDTEMYMLPFFIYTQPDVAKSLLSYRYTILEQARDRAREMAIQTGALFAWRTINGEEASPYYPAGTAQIHINGDIAHAVDEYVQATDDAEFKWNKGLEIVSETARFYYNWGHFDETKQGAFVLNEVTGPDEYTALVNNNYYTNLIAQKNLLLAAEWIEEALEDDVKEAKDVLDSIGFSESELEDWKEAADTMFFPYEEERQLSMQDDSFFSKKVWDFENTPEENHPLLLHYHPMTIYKHQVNKQADTVLAQIVFPEVFSLEQRARDYDYYEGVTTHDSSLSRSIFGIAASALDRMDKAYSYFMDTALMDLNDMQSNTKDGVHAANMGGTWMSIVTGFAGMSVVDNQLTFKPRLPKEWQALRFSIQFKNRHIRVEMTEGDTQYTLLEGESLEIKHFDEVRELK